MSLSRPVQPSSNGGEKRSFKKECVVKVRTSNLSNVNIVDLIEAVENVCGEGSCFACILRSPTHYEVTVINEENSKLLCEGLKIGDDNYMCDRLCETTVVVSFMNLASYVEDREIITRLNGHGIEVMGEVNRRYYGRSKCCDGTRFIRSKFPPHIRSLPYAMQFETVASMQSFHVIHSDQQRVCWNVIQSIILSLIALMFDVEFANALDMYPVVVKVYHVRFVINVAVLCKKKINWMNNFATHLILTNHTRKQVCYKNQTSVTTVMLVHQADVGDITIIPRMPRSAFLSKQGKINASLSPVPKRGF
ncbi:hypothetical protein SNE40_017294 [Patella caerulea]|uniref:Uncharacterized protein n=1 Tax=Patella caerulea TaxID=87958 RepID=A0AAN8P9G8_PATCE